MKNLFFGISFLGCLFTNAQFSNFISLEPLPINDHLILPSTHQFQYLSQEGDSLDGNILKGWPDFTCYFPLNGSSEEGILALNHELNNVNAAVSMMPISLDSTGYWTINGHNYLDFSQVAGTSRPCSGGMTSWGTIVIGEEDTSINDVDGNDYHDWGWLVEFDPVVGEIVDYGADLKPDKVWKCGKMLHENICFFNDSIAFFGADDANWGFLYKFVCDAPQDLSSGTLYVLVADSVNGSTANWYQVANGTPADCNRVQHFSRDHNATNFQGIEDCEVGPDGKVYFTSKFTGRIYRLTGTNTSVNDLEIYVESQSYNILHENGVTAAQWGGGHDNLLFDDQGNLYVCQDGGEFYVWLVRNDHTMANPKIDIFARTPDGGEPTGMTFSPDYKYIFMSFMHPFANNQDSLTDAFGQKRIFNRGTTVVISRKPVDYLQESQIQNVKVWQNGPYIRVESLLDFQSYNLYAADGKLVNSGKYFDFIPVPPGLKGTFILELKGPSTHFRKKLILR